MPPLNPRQSKFVELYLAGHTATEAYIKAGYKARGSSAEVGAAQLLRNTKVKQVVEAAQRKASKARDMSAEWFAARVKVEAEREGEGSSHAARVAALKLAGQFLGVLSEKHELTGKDGGPIETKNEHSLTGRIESLADAFARSADREEAGGVPGDGAGEPVRP